MAWFKRRRKETPQRDDSEFMPTGAQVNDMHETHHESDAMQSLVDDVVHHLAKEENSESGRPRFWLDHGFENGDMVECAVCGMSLEVKILKYTQVVLGTKDAWVGRALICGDCGRLFCLDCSLWCHPNRSTCDQCKIVGGVTSLMN